MTIVVPGTSKLAALRFPHTIVVKPDAANGLREVTVLLGFQLQAVDSRWIENPPIGRLAPESLMELENVVLEVLGFDVPEEE